MQKYRLANMLLFNTMRHNQRAAKGMMDTTKIFTSNV